MKPLSRVWPPPSLLARKILCPAYIGAPFNSQTASKFQGLHASAAMRVIARHLRMQYKLDAIEKRGAGFRIDLVFVKPGFGTRLVEVKSSNKIREVHKLQAALYPNNRYNEIVVSNRHQDVILDHQFIYEASARAQQTRELLSKDPQKAAISYMPHEDVCYTCANESCPFNGMNKELAAAADPPQELEFISFDDSE